MADGQAAGGQPTFPVLAASASGIGEYAITQVQRLPAPAAPVQLSAATMASETAVPGQAVLTVRTTAEQAYRQVLAIASEHRPVDAYLTAGPVSYQRSGDGTLTPVQVRNPVSVWQLGRGDFRVARRRPWTRPKASTGCWAGTRRSGWSPVAARPRCS